MFSLFNSLTVAQTGCSLVKCQRQYMVQVALIRREKHLFSTLPFFCLFFLTNCSPGHRELSYHWFCCQKKTLWSKIHCNERCRDSVCFQCAQGPIRLTSFQCEPIFLVTFNVGVACYFQAVLAGECSSRYPANTSPSFGLHLWLSSLVPPARCWPTSASSCRYSSLQSICKNVVKKIQKNCRRKTTDAARLIATGGKKGKDRRERQRGSLANDPECLIRAHH